MLRLYKQETKSEKSLDHLDAKKYDAGVTSMNLEASVKHWEMSGKLKRLFNLLADWNQQNVEMDPSSTPNKVLIFSRTKKMLNVIEKLIEERSYRYCRMDGDVPVTRRQTIIE